jgi:hypothetical protein
VLKSVRVWSVTLGEASGAQAQRIMGNVIILPLHDTEYPSY